MPSTDRFSSAGDPDAQRSSISDLTDVLFSRDSHRRVSNMDLLHVGRIGRPEDAATSLYVPGINVVICPDAATVYDLVASEVLELFRSSGKRGLGTATGGTMLPIWERIYSRMPKENNLSELYTVGLDEYVGLPPECPQSYHYEMRQRLEPFERYGFNLDYCYLGLGEELR